MKVVNPDATIEFRDNTPDDPSRRKPDITKVHQPVSKGFRVEDLASNHFRSA